MLLGRKIWFLRPSLQVYCLKMVAPKLKSHDLYNRLNKYFERCEVPPKFTLQKFSLEADSLVTVSALDSYLIKMMIGVLSGDAAQVLAFAKKASHLLPTANDTGLALLAFLNCIWLSGNANQIDVNYWLNYMIGDKSDPKNNTVAINFAMKMGHLDWVESMFESVCGEDQEFDRDNIGFKDVQSAVETPGVLKKWAEIKSQVESAQQHLVSLLVKYQSALIKRFGASIKGSAYSVDEDGILFVEVLVKDSIDPEQLTQFNWEMDELTLRESSPIVPCDL